MLKSFEEMMVEGDVANHMDDILKNFENDPKITVLVRTPHNPDDDFMMTTDTIPEIRAMLDRREKEQNCDQD